MTQPYFGSRISNIPIVYMDKLQNSPLYTGKRFEKRVEECGVEISFEKKKDTFDIVTKGSRMRMLFIDGWLQAILGEILKKGDTYQYTPSKISSKGFGLQRNQK